MLFFHQIIANEKHVCDNLMKLVKRKSTNPLHFNIAEDMGGASAQGMSFRRNPVAVFCLPADVGVGCDRLAAIRDGMSQ